MKKPGKYLLLCFVFLGIVGIVTIPNNQLGLFAQVGDLGEFIVEFETVPVNSGYKVGDQILSESIDITFAPYFLDNGEETGDGSAIISQSGNAGGTGNELMLNNINAKFRFIRAESIRFSYGANGGNVNIEINGERIFNITDPVELDGYVFDNAELHVINWDDSIGQIEIVGDIQSFSLGGQEFVIDDVILVAEVDEPPISPPTEPLAVRILLVTQGNIVVEHRVDIVPGTARGHATQFNQWLVTVLNENKQPLDAYGIWDPRLTLVHETNSSIHSFFELDSETGYLFDIVFPFVDEDGLVYDSTPREVLVHDQELQLIVDTDLTDAIEVYCQENSTTTELDIQFEKTPIEREYRGGDQILSESIDIMFVPFLWSNNEEYSDGFAVIRQDSDAGGTGNELWLNNINAQFQFARAESIRFSFGTYGGNVNVEINGERIFNISDPVELDGYAFDDAELNVINWDNSIGQIEIVGDIRSFSLGGQEFVIDNVIVGTSVLPLGCNLNPEFEPLTSLYQTPTGSGRPRATDALSLNSGGGNYMGNSELVAGCLVQAYPEVSLSEQEWIEWLASCGREVTTR